jgi:hypothetical protein
VARRAALLALAAAGLAGCATTRVTTSEPDAVIWFDGRPVGRSGKVFAVGPPHTARVVVVGKDGRRARALVAREPTARTLEAGFWTMGFCLVFCWRYPEQVHVPLPPPERRISWEDDPARDAWGTAPVDLWAMPPAAPPAAVKQPAASAAPAPTPTPMTATPTR